MERLVDLGKPIISDDVDTKYMSVDYEQLITYRRILSEILNLSSSNSYVAVSNLLMLLPRSTVKFKINPEDLEEVNRLAEASYFQHLQIDVKIVSEYDIFNNENVHYLSLIYTGDSIEV